ncbi:MAG: hypothetical protein WD361_10330 [Gracilimonas sp.]
MIFNKVFLLILASFCINLSDLQAQQNESSDADGSITGTVVLSPRNSPVRFGGGLYGRSSSPAASRASADSVLVILVSPNNSNTSPKEAPVTLDQKDNSFVPNLLPVPLNQVVRIRNSDPVYHNVFSLSSTKKFDVGRRPKGEYLDVEFDKAGIVDVFCDIHSNMHAVIYVMPPNATGWIKVKNGEAFDFDQIEPGSYELKVYARGYEEMSFPVEISIGENVQLGTLTMNS